MLLKDEYDVRLRFCDEIMQRCDDNNGFPLFSDEATAFPRQMFEAENLKYRLHPNKTFNSYVFQRYSLKISPLKHFDSNRMELPHIFVLISENIAMKYLQDAELDDIVQLNSHQNPQPWRH